MEIDISIKFFDVLHKASIFIVAEIITVKYLNSGQYYLLKLKMSFTHMYRRRETVN